MKEVNLKTDEIRLKIVKLLQLHADLQKKYDQLEEENRSLKINLENQKNTIDSLEERNKIVKLAESLGNSNNDIHTLKKKVNEYIREIDECIRLLSDR